MAYVIAEPRIGTKDTACVDACPWTAFTPERIDLIPVFRTEPSTIFLFRSGADGCRRAGTRRRR